MKRGDDTALEAPAGLYDSDAHDLRVLQLGDRRKEGDAALSLALLAALQRERLLLPCGRTQAAE